MSEFHTATKKAALNIAIFVMMMHCQSPAMDSHFTDDKVRNVFISTLAHGSLLFYTILVFETVDQQLSIDIISF